jgi:hypothetical protein
MSEKAQSFKNHVKFVPAFHFFALPVFLLNFIWVICRVRFGFSFGWVVQVLVAAALITIALLARIFALKVQDRVIRLEERLRLAQLLPSDLRPRINDFSADELVGLRFASDEEVPELARRILEGKLKGRKAIKRQVKNWRADYLRA